VNYFTVENLNVTSLHATQGRGIFITNGASNITIRNNTVRVSTTNTSSTAFGIIASGVSYLLDGSLSTNLTIKGNTVVGGYSSIQLTGENFTSVATKLVNSLVESNIVQDFYGYGVYLNYTDGVTVRSNEISRPTRTTSGSDSQTPAAIIVSAGSTNFMLDKNRIFNLQAAMGVTTTISRGIYIGGTSTAQSSGNVQNNLIYGMSNDGSQYGIQSNSTVGPINIFHNTVVLDNGAGTGNANAIYLSNSTAQAGHSVLNNILFITKGGTGVKRMFEVSSASTSFTSNYNVVWLSPSAGSPIFGRVASTDYATLGDWQTAFSRDLNSFAGDPLFTSPGTGNYKPTNPATDGTTLNTVPVGVADDILGTIRSGKPDPGAYEYGDVVAGPVYTFIGDGNWDVPANWSSNTIPPSPLPAGSEIVINPAGTAILNVPYIVGPGGKLTVMAGKNFVILGNLTIQQ
jgi:hypothetical protein